MQSANSETFPVSDPDLPGYRLPPDENFGGEAVQGAISEEELKRRIEEGGRVEDVVAVRVRVPLINKTRYFPYLRLSWRRGFLGIAKWRETGLRNYSDADRLLDRLAAPPAEQGYGYAGVVRIVPAGHPLIDKLRLLNPEGE